jgi:hypothetical protein
MVNGETARSTDTDAIPSRTKTTTMDSSWTATDSERENTSGQTAASTKANGSGTR